MHRRFTHGLVVFLIIFSGSAFAQEMDRGKPKKSTTGAVFRSLAVPGWGQWYNESRVKAVSFLALETFFIYRIFQNNSSMLAAKRAGDVSPLMFDRDRRGLAAPESYDRFIPVVAPSTFREEHFYRSNRNKLVWWLAGIKLLSLGDAYVDAQLFDIDISPDLALFDTDGFLLGATIRF